MVSSTAASDNLFCRTHRYHIIQSYVSHRRRKVKNIGGPRFRILVGGQIPSRHMTSY